MKAKRTARNAAKREPETLEWLEALNRSGQRRIEALSWGRLARIHAARKSGPEVRRNIEREARRCGYEPATILGLNAWK